MKFECKLANGENSGTLWTVDFLSTPQVGDTISCHSKEVGRVVQEVQVIQRRYYFDADEKVATMFLVVAPPGVQFAQPPAPGPRPRQDTPLERIPPIYWQAARDIVADWFMQMCVGTLDTDSRSPVDWLESCSLTLTILTWPTLPNICSARHYLEMHS
jgi:hypothetical protein